MLQTFAGTLIVAEEKSKHLETLRASIYWKVCVASPFRGRT